MTIVFGLNFLYLFSSVLETEDFDIWRPFISFLGRTESLKSQLVTTFPEVGFLRSSAYSSE
jgi:hypothetical protein